VPTGRLAAGLTCAAVLWGLAMLIVPLEAGRRFPSISALVYGASAIVCHQRPERSFHLDGARLPVCARCTALYLFGALGAVLGWVRGPRVPRHLPAVLSAVSLPMVLSVAGEWTGVAAGSNTLRAASAVLLGLFTGWLFVRMLRAEGAAAHMRYDFPL